MKKFLNGLALFLLLVMCTGMTVAAEKEEGYYTVLAGCNLRRTPSIEGVIVTVVKEGEVVYFMGSRTGGYSFVRFGDIEGYIVSGVIGDPADSLNAADKAEEIVPGDTAAEGIAEAGVPAAEEEVTSEVNIPSREDPEALAARRALRKSMGQKIGEGSKNLVKEELITVEKGHILATVNFRTAPDIKSKSLCLIPEGEVVDIEEGGSQEFAKVTYDGQEGYVYKKCIDFETVTEPGGSDGMSMASGSNRIATGAMLNGLIIGAYEMEMQQASESVRDAVREDENNMQAEVAARQMIARNDIKEATVGGKKISSVIPDIAGQAMPGSGNTVSMVQYNGLSSGVKVDNSTLNNGQAPEVADGDVFELTAYCTCRICCGNFSPEVTGLQAHTATGTVPTQGRTIAVDPSVIPYGSTVVIDGVGTFIAEDTGGAIKSHRIDIYFETHEAAIAFGRQKRKVIILR